MASDSASSPTVEEALRSAVARFALLADVLELQALGFERADQPVGPEGSRALAETCRQAVGDLQRLLRPVRQTGSMDSPAPPQNPVGAMEETADSVSQNGRTGTRGCACAQGPRHRARRLVERGGLAHACGREQSLACGVGTPEPSDSTPGSAAEHLNRRVRNRTHGGVGGREG